MGQRTNILRKFYLGESPLLYIEDQYDLPDWKKFWFGLLNLLNTEYEEY